jgi:hypothetical protein
MLYNLWTLYLRVVEILMIRKLMFINKIIVHKKFVDVRFDITHFK